MRFKPDGFIIALCVTILLARFFPAGPEAFPLDRIAKWGVSAIFFFYGLRLNKQKLSAGLFNLPLHLLILLITFLLFPVIVLSGYTLAGISPDDTPLWTGLFFLAALPSTVSTSVVMVSIAKGNVPAAIFSASLSGLAGILITPLWMSTVMSTDQYPYDFSNVYSNLLLEVMLPVFLGWLLHQKAGALAEKYSKQLSLFDRFIILIIIYKSFAQSFSSGIFDALDRHELLLVSILVVLLFVLIFIIAGLLSGIFHFNRADTITVQYCGTKKSLVHGTVFAGILFGTNTVTGIILIPLILFHALQILMISIHASRQHRLFTREG